MVGRFIDAEGLRAFGSSFISLVLTSDNDGLQEVSGSSGIAYTCFPNIHIYTWLNTSNDMATCIFYTYDYILMYARM